MARCMEGKKVPGAAGEEGRKDRQEDATLVSYLIEKQLDISRVRLQEEAVKGDLDKRT